MCYRVREIGVLDAENVQGADGVDRVIHGLVPFKYGCHLTIFLYCFKRRQSLRPDPDAGGPSA